MWFVIGYFSGAVSVIVIETFFVYHIFFKDKRYGKSEPSQSL